MSSATGLYIDIEDGSGTRLGSGPIVDAAFWESTARMDRAGQFAFTIPATIEKATLVQSERVARAYAIVGGVWTEVGAGPISKITRVRNADGKVDLAVTGDDLLRELTYRSVQGLKLYDGGLPVSHAAALAAVAAYVPVGWTLTPDGGPPNDLVYGRFNGESVLAAIIKIADKSQNHFYRGVGRTVVYANAFTPSGIRAIQAGPDDLVAETCAVTRVREQIDTYDLITRIYPKGSGNGDVQLTLAATTRTAPTGYVLDTTNNYIEHTASAATYGRREQVLEYREIGPISNTNADVEAAANALFDAALEELTRRSTELVQATYDLGIAGCSSLLRPMQSIRLVIDDAAAGMAVDADLNILEATWRITANEVQTTGLIVTNADRWPASDTDAIVGSMTQGQVYQALPQLNANSYVIGISKNVDPTETAIFRFRFGLEVVQIQQVTLDFQILPFESTVRTIAGATSGSGTIASNGPSVDSTNSAGNNETSSGGPTTTDSTTPTIGSTTPAIGSTTPAIGTTTPTIGSTTPAIGSVTPVIGNASLTTSDVTPTIGTTTPTIGSTGLTANSTALETDAPEEGDTLSAGRHQHTIGITLGGTVTYPIGYSAAGTAGGLVSTLGGGTHNYPTNQSGNHTHDIGDHTHAITEHTHTIVAHTHTIAGHTHTITAHAHTIAAHTHTIAAHTHTIAAHTHTIAAHDHTIAAHTHTIAAHTHTITAHTHGMSQHTHTLNNHTHDLSESLTAVYGIYREDIEETYTIDELFYRVNGGSILGLESAVTDFGDGWYSLDLTSIIVDPTTFRPLQASNTVQFYGSPSKTGATIDAQLTVRNIIQAIAYV